jgi:hypothetical protein
MKFKESLQLNAPPDSLSELQSGLWFAAKGDWNAAHNIVQNHEGEKDFDLLHAHLHRVEGDSWNANYWYRRAGKNMPSKSVKEELEEIIDLYC